MFFALCSSFLDCQFPKDFFGKLGYSKKSPNRGEEGEVEDILFLKKNLESLDLSLYTWNFQIKQAFTPGNSA